MTFWIQTSSRVITGANWVSFLIGENVAGEGVASANCKSDDSSSWLFRLLIINGFERNNDGCDWLRWSSFSVKEPVYDKRGNDGLKIEFCDVNNIEFCGDNNIEFVINEVLELVFGLVIIEVDVWLRSIGFGLLVELLSFCNSIEVLVAWNAGC